MNSQAWLITSESSQGRLEIVDGGLRIATASQAQTIPWNQIQVVEFGDNASATVRSVASPGAGTVSLDPTLGAAFAKISRPVERVVEFGTAAEVGAFRDALWRCGKLRSDCIAVLPPIIRNSDRASAAARGAAVKKPRPVANTAVAAGVGAYVGIRAVLVGAGVLIIVLGLVYTHSSSFKEQCLMHKLEGESIGLIKNVVCDADFTIKN